MVEEGDWVAIFHSIHRVMKAENILKQRKLPMLLIPVPRQLASDCGLAIRFSDEEVAGALALLSDEGVSPVELYRLQGETYVQQEQQ